MFRRSMQAWAGVVIVGLLAGVSIAFSGAANAAQAQSGEKRYLALGDSIPFGSSPLVEDPRLWPDFVGYPEVIDQQSQLTTTNFSCPGQTAEALNSLKAFDAGCFEMRKEAADQGFNMLHTEYTGTQLAAALAAIASGERISLISIQGGGNEVSTCAFEAKNPERCLTKALPKVGKSLRHTVSELRDAGYKGRIVLVGYHLHPDLAAPIGHLNSTIERAADSSDVSFAAVARSFARYARAHHGDICTTGLLIKMPDGSCDLHPTPTGRDLYVKTVLKAAYGNKAS